MRFSVCFIFECFVFSSLAFFHCLRLLFSAISTISLAKRKNADCVLEEATKKHSRQKNERSERETHSERGNDPFSDELFRRLSFSRSLS